MINIVSLEGKDQLQILQAGALLLPYQLRGWFLQSTAARLGTSAPSDDVLKQAVVDTLSSVRIQAPPDLFERAIPWVTSTNANSFRPLTNWPQIDLLDYTKQISQLWMERRARLRRQGLDRPPAPWSRRPDQVDALAPTSLRFSARFSQMDCLAGDALSTMAYADAQTQRLLPDGARRAFHRF